MAFIFEGLKASLMLLLLWCHLDLLQNGLPRELVRKCSRAATDASRGPSV